MSAEDLVRISASYVCTKASTERHTPENKPLATFIGSTGFQFAFAAPSRNLSTTNHPLLRERLKIDPKTFSCPYNMTQLSLTHSLLEYSKMLTNSTGTVLPNGRILSHKEN